jgi:predicted transcriptional regulator
MEKNESLDILIQECLKSVGVSLLGDWDVLVFLYRHRASLANAEHIARLLGYPKKAVAEALGRLESQGFVQRSRPSQGVRFYQIAFPEAHVAPDSGLRRLMQLAEDRTGRLLLVKHLLPSEGLHLAPKGNQSD